MDLTKSWFDYSGNEKLRQRLSAPNLGQRWRTADRSNQMHVERDRTIHFMFERAATFPHSEVIDRFLLEPFWLYLNVPRVPITRAADRLMAFGLAEGLVALDVSGPEARWSLLRHDVTFIPRISDGTRIALDVRDPASGARRGLALRESSFRRRKGAELHTLACNQTISLVDKMNGDTRVPDILSKYGITGFERMAEARRYLLDHQHSAPTWLAMTIWATVWEMSWYGGPSVDVGPTEDDAEALALAADDF